MPPSSSKNIKTMEICIFKKIYVQDYTLITFHHAGFILYIYLYIEIIPPGPHCCRQQDSATPTGSACSWRDVAIRALLSTIRVLRDVSHGLLTLPQSSLPAGWSHINDSSQNLRYDSQLSLLGIKAS